MENIVRSTESLPVIYLRAGSNYEAGKAIGSTFKSWINTYLETANDVQLFRKFYKSTSGRKIYDGYLDAAQTCYPHIVSEIRGIADGACQAFEDIFLLQIASEILFCHSQPDDTANDNDTQVDSGKGCTDVLVNREGFRMIGHNDDWDEDVSKYVYVANVTIDSTENTAEETDETMLRVPKQHFVSYHYPGFLAGFCFGMNKYLVISINSLVPRQASAGSVPVSILLRALLECSTIDECSKVMENKPFGCSYGMNINIAVIGGTDMCSMEVYPDMNGTKVHVRLIPHGSGDSQPCYFIHQNHYKHMEVEERGECMGSKLRDRRANEMGPPETKDDVKAILGDTKDTVEPIYKTPCETHIETDEKTSATALFDLTEKRLEIYRSNPKHNETPCVVLPFLY